MSHLRQRFVPAASAEFVPDPRLTDPDAAAAVAAINAAQSSWLPAHLAGVAEVRRRIRSPVVRHESVRSRDIVLPGAAGPIGARIFTPDRPNGGTILFIHGGGWVIGGPDANNGLCQELCDRTGSVLVNVDYRLAPENPYPAALEDVTGALVWLAAGGDGIVDVDPARIAVAGHSAGGALAAALTRRSRDGQAPRISHQALLCPVLDHDLDRPSYRENESGLLLSRAEMVWYWEQYLPDLGRRERPDASPLRAKDLTGLPPTTIVAGGADPLRDEALAYATRLVDAGVDTTTILQAGVPHLFLQLPAVRSRIAVLDAVSERIRASFAVEPTAPSR